MARKMLKKSQLRSIFNISLHFTEIRTSIENLPLTQWSARSITKSIRITPSFSLASTSLPSTKGKYSQITERNAAKLPNETQPNYRTKHSQITERGKENIKKVCESQIFIVILPTKRKEYETIQK